MPHGHRRFQREAPTALSGSHFKPPALPEVSDSGCSTWIGFPEANVGRIAPTGGARSDNGRKHPGQAWR